MIDERPVTVGDWLDSLIEWALTSLIDWFLALPVAVLVVAGGVIFAAYAVYDTLRILITKRWR